MTFQAGRYALEVPGRDGRPVRRFVAPPLEEFALEFGIVTWHRLRFLRWLVRSGRVTEDV